MNAFDNLYCKLNRVTANWRHSGSVSSTDMNALCNAQVELDESGYTPCSKESPATGVEQRHAGSQAQPKRCQWCEYVYGAAESPCVGCTADRSGTASA